MTHIDKLSGYLRRNDMKILNFSSHYEDCGIAKYQESYVDEINKTEGFETTFFEYSPYQTRDMNDDEFSNVIAKLTDVLGSYDIFHIQHEFGFYRRDQLLKLVDTAKAAGTKVAITFHTSPDLIIIKKPLSGFGPRNIISFIRSYRHNYILEKIHIKPLIDADIVIAHNTYTSEKLQAYGVPNEKITLLPHPTYGVTKPKKTHYIEKSLKKKDGDIILSTVGYIHRFKGVDKAVKALSYLPDNYKLAILGGVKSDSDDQRLYDEIADLVIERDLRDRVFITGVVPDDNDLNSYIRETDISLYPYDSAYYKGVASGALNLAIANERPIVAYPVSTLKETNSEIGQLVLTQSDSYYELAKEIQLMNIPAQAEKIRQYASDNSWQNMTARLLDIYKSI